MLQLHKPIDVSGKRTRRPVQVQEEAIKKAKTKTKKQQKSPKNKSPNKADAKPAPSPVKNEAKLALVTELRNDLEEARKRNSSEGVIKALLDTLNNFEKLCELPLTE